MKDKTLLILAAGMGSRFGGLKQITPLGPNGEFIIDYSAYDAIKAGFNKIVFLIKEENHDIFKETIGKRVEPYINVEYCFQKNDNIPAGYSVPETRVKPLGTAHAILCCKDKIHEPFCIINADDFYGLDAYKKASIFLNNIENNTCGIITYNVLNTMSKNGSVKRGLCTINNNLVVNIEESIIDTKDKEITCSNLDGSNKRIIPCTSYVSMNMITFSNSIFEYLEKKYDEFLENSNLLKDEFLIPEVVKDGINEGVFKVHAINTDSEWVGVTYKEDAPYVKEYISNLIEKGVYKKNLWK